MFDAFGWAVMSPGCLITPSQCFERLARLRAGDRGVLASCVAPAPKRKHALRRLMKHLTHIGRRRQPSTI
jgi:hypothetical protein